MAPDTNGVDRTIFAAPDFSDDSGQVKISPIKGQMNQKIEIFSFVTLPSPNTKKEHPK